MLKEISLVESHSQASKEATASLAVHETVGDGMEERSQTFLTPLILTERDLVR